MQKYPKLAQELFRKSIHISGLLFYFLKPWLPLESPLLWLGLIFLISLIEILRSFNILSFLNKIFGLALRKEEFSSFSGAFYYFWGIGLAFLFFPLKIAFIALWILCMADGIAGLFGRTFLHSVVFFLSSLCIVFFFLHTLTPTLILKALFWTAIEKIKIIDDNLAIPLAVCVSFS